MHVDLADTTTAFIGRTKRGLADEPTRVFDYGEFERFFGGRTRDLPLTYAVEDYYNNGGSNAIIVRVCAGAPPETASTLELTVDEPKYILTSKLRGPISTQLFLEVTKRAADPGAASGPEPQSATYTLRFLLGSASFNMVLDARTDSPAAIDQWLKSRSTVVSADDGGTPPTADTMTTILDALVGRENVFAGGASTGCSTATFVAGAGESRLQIQATGGGAWCEGLDFSVVPKGSAEECTLCVDHGSFEQPYCADFSDWSELARKLSTETGFLQLTAVPAAASADPRAWVRTGRSFARVSDGLGASAAMLFLGPLVVTASSPGSWGNAIGVTFDKTNITDDVAIRFADCGIENADDFWNVSVYYQLTDGQTAAPPAERIWAVYIGPIDSPCRIDHALEGKSSYLRALAPVLAATESELAPVLNPPRVGLLDSTNADPRLGMLEHGQDGVHFSSDIVIGEEAARTGLSSLDQVDRFDILVIPPDPLLNGIDDMSAIYRAAAPYCAIRRAILIADPPDRWAEAARSGWLDDIRPSDLGIVEIASKRSVFSYFPRIVKRDPEDGDREKPFCVSGAIAGIFARTDAECGPWASPAGIKYPLNGAATLEHVLSDAESVALLDLGINSLRRHSGPDAVICGSRTLAGATVLSDDYQCLPVRRLVNYIEESVLRGTKFAVFEPNAEPLWGWVRLTIDSFLANLSRRGAFYGYYVRCDKSTTTQYDIDRGRLNVVVCIAPVKPAEFVTIAIQHSTGGSAG